MRPPAQFDGQLANEAETEQQDPRMVAMMISTRLAGRAVIRVVGRCEEAQENQELGNSHYRTEKIIFFHSYTANNDPSDEDF